MSKAGYNVNASSINDQAQGDAVAANADMDLLMTVPQQIDDVGVNGQTEINQAADWAQAIAPAQLVWRTYSKKEGNWKAFPSNDVIVNRWVKEGHPDIIRDDPSNEVSLAGDNKQINQDFVLRSVGLLNQASFAGITVAIGAFSVGTPHQNLINDGTYDPLIRAVVEGGHYFSVHEYCPGIPGAGDVFPYDELLKPETVLSKMKDDLWPLGEYWLLRRSDRLIKRARELGLTDPQIIVTEAFIDYIPDAETVLTQLRNQYGLPECNNDMRGVLAWPKYYADAFKSMPALSHYELQVRYLIQKLLKTVYNVPWIKGVCFFALNRDWDSPECHNWLNDRLVTVRQVHIPAINASLEAPPVDPEPPEYIMLDAMLWSESQSYIRSGSGKMFDILHTLTPIKERGQISNIPVTTNEGYDWYEVSIEANDSHEAYEVGYVADTGNFKWSKGHDPEPPTEPPEPDYITRTEAQAMIDGTLSGLLKSLAAHLIEEADSL